MRGASAMRSPRIGCLFPTTLLLHRLPIESRTVAGAGKDQNQFQDDDHDGKTFELTVLQETPWLRKAPLVDVPARKAEALAVQLQPNGACQLPPSYGFMAAVAPRACTRALAIAAVSKRHLRSTPISRLRRAWRTESSQCSRSRDWYRCKPTTSRSS
jgi:hypothetical protein